MKKYKYLILTIFLLFLLLLNSSFGYYFGKINVSTNHNIYEKEFNINKVENYTYKLSFIHYGIMNKTGVVYIYLNDIVIYKIDKGNKINSNQKPYPKVSINITDYLKDGRNKLKVYAEKLNSHNYYVLKDVYINEPQTKTPISFGLMIITLLIMSFLIYKRGIS